MSNQMIKFTNGLGETTWILPSTVVAMWIQEGPNYCLACMNTSWTTNKEDFFRILETVQAFRKSVDSSDDWWKTGGKNPLDGEEEEDEDTD